MRKQRSVRLLEEVDEGIEGLAERTGRDFSAIVNELLEEALKMRRIPGIYFADTPSGRVATIAGTGLGVWEIIMAYRTVDEEWDRLRESFHWLSEYQLRSALAFAEAYPDEIERRIQRDEQWTHPPGGDQPGGYSIGASSRPAPGAGGVSPLRGPRSCDCAPRASRCD